ncbi:MAG: phytanoyl-CoA dioxygenase family protein [Gemmatimonadetes bacterium]|nr:phytanoyl-CoA dioxygenase family protein [Gemmatimonadota bacterium]
MSYTTQPVQCFLMYYLTDTAPQNGCLRVIPGSHLKRHSLHDRISPRHTEELRKFANPDDPGFSRTDDEVDVPVESGDLVMGYGSLLHASHANRSDRRRTVLTMWYYHAFVSLPERTRGTVASLEADNSDVPYASPEIKALLEPLKIAYHGKAEPIETEWTPGEALK